VTILITGPTGVVGRRLTTDLAAARDLRTFSRSDHSEAGVEHIRADIRDFDAVLAATKGVDTVVHLSGFLEDLDPLETLEVNLRGTYHVLEAARLQGVSRVVFASSIAVTGCLTSSFIPDFLPIREGDACRPASAYAAGKLAAETLCDMYSRRYGLTTVALRFAGVQHPETWTTPLWENERCPILWTWISLGDLSRAIQAAIDAPISGSLLATVAAADACSFRPTRELAGAFCPGAIIRDSPEDETGEQRWPMFSIQRARESLGWEPTDRFEDLFARRVPR
jgi:nucleoside-diphosphate-sugar epimerase